MTTLLIEDADVIVTMDDDRQEIQNGYVAIKDGVITETGAGPVSAQVRSGFDKVIKASGCVVTPGLINTHHHLFQTITRGVPQAQDALLFGWLQTLYPIWCGLTSEDVVASAQLGLIELAATGCTMTADHHYLYPNDVSLSDTIEAAHRVGLRLLATRGSMSIGESQGGLPPDRIVEDEDAILKDTIDLADRFHRSGPGAMVQIGVAPCSPFSVTTDLMRESAILARDKGLRLHTHLAENVEDVEYSLEKFGCRPGQYAENLGWVGEDVWHAHCVQLDDSEVELFAQTGTGVSHCPGSNCRLGSGIAPIRDMLAAGVPVSIGVDGSASNDIAHMLNETRHCLMLQRVQSGADAMTARSALEVATRGGAKVLGRTDLGVIALGYHADLAIWDVQNLHSTGGWDPVAALILNGPQRVRDLIVEGRAIIQDERFISLNLPDVLAEAETATNRLKALV